MVRSPNSDTDFFDIVVGIFKGDTLAPYLFILCLNYVFRILIDQIKENGFTLKKARRVQYSAEILTDADYTDDLALLANNQPKSHPYCIE